jgi:hypothetical protein
VSGPSQPVITYADDEPNGLASMLGTLMQQNLARDPGRRRYLRTAVVALTANDADVGVTLRIRRGGVEVANGADPHPDLEVVTDAHRLLDLAAVPLRLRLPDPFTARGREVTRALMSGRLRVIGLGRHPIRLMRLNALLSAA